MCTTRAAPQNVGMETPRYTCRSLARLALIGMLAVSGMMGSTSTVSAATCTNAGYPTTSDPGTVAIADNFESGTLSKWDEVRREGDATVAVVSGGLYGWCGLRVTATSRSDSRASVREWLPSGNRTIRGSAWFKVEREGYSGSNVPLWRFFNGSSRMIDLHRQNGTGALWLRTSDGGGGWRYVKMGYTMPLHTWVRIKIRVTADYGSSDVEVYVNGVRYYSNWSHYMPTKSLTMSLFGSEHVKQVMDLRVDEVVIKGD